MKIGLVIPWRETPSRIKPLQMVLDWYQTNLPNIEVIYIDRQGEFWSASGSRNDGVRKAQEAHCDVIIINDADTISEISTFIEKKGSYEAGEGYHDDLVMPLVLFSWLTTNSYFKDLNNVNLREIMYKKQMKAIEEELTPFGFYDDGLPEKAPLNF